MPRISEFYGIAIYIYYSDHGPPHFHATYGQHEAVIAIESGAMLKGHLPPRALRLVRRWVKEYRNELMGDWLLARDHQRLAPAPPLE